MNANGDVRSQCSQASFCRYVEINVARQVSVSAFHLFVADTASKCSMERRTGLSCTFQLPQVYDSVLGISSIFPGFRCNCSTPFTTPGRAGERGRDGQDAQRKYKAVLHYLVGMRPRFNQCNPVYMFEPELAFFGDVVASEIKTWKHIPSLYCSVSGHSYQCEACSAGWQAACGQCGEGLPQ